MNNGGDIPTQGASWRAGPVRTRESEGHMQAADDELGGSGWDGHPHEVRSPPRHPAPDRLLVHESTRGGCLSGTVRDLKQRSETGVDRGRTVWNFRLDCYDTKGDVTQRIPVEIRGIWFEGAL